MSSGTPKGPSGSESGARAGAEAVDFSALIMGFSSAALYYLGEGDVAGKGGGQKNVPLAKQNIDIITLLREKTKGNLDAEEERLIAQVLLDLQVKFVEASKS
jgi:hypothetical protein